MILPVSFSVIFNHPADLCVAVLALASKDEVFPLHFRRLQDNRYRPKALPAEDIVENPLLGPLGDCLPSPCCLWRERISWMDGHYHLFFSLNPKVTDYGLLQPRLNRALVSRGSHSVQCPVRSPAS